MQFLTVEFWEVCAVLLTTAAACAVVGPYLVLRRMALLTDAIGHVLLFGIALAFLATHDLESPWLLIGAALTGLGTVVAVEAVSRSKYVKEDAAIGLVFPALFAAGVLLVTLFAKGTHLDIDRVLFGLPELAPLRRQIIGNRDFGPVAVLIMSGVFLLNVAFLTVFHKELKLGTFDAVLANLLGFTPLVLHYVLMGLVSVTAVTAFDAVGPVLVVAFFILPAATGYLLTDRLSWLLVYSVLLGMLAAFVGTVLAFWMQTPTSGTVAVTMGVLFAITLFVAPRHGILTRELRRRFFVQAG